MSDIRNIHKPKHPTLKQSYDIMRNHYSNTWRTLPSEMCLAYETTMTCVYKRLLSEYKSKGSNV